MEIETSARLHLSLIDLNGSEGRLDGGIGITLQQPSLNIDFNDNENKTKIIFEQSFNKTNTEVYKSKILEATQKMNNYLNVDTNYVYKIKDIYPIHHGLGLGTQLALSVAKLISTYHQVELSTIDLAKIIQRGGTSGVGVYSFDQGGIIIDGGHKKSLKKDFLPSSASKVAPPPLLARYDFPEEWNIVLVTPNMNEGASGNNEINIFQHYSPIDIRDVQKISYLTLMKLMPAVLERDIYNFGDAVNKIQSLGFKKIERSLQNTQINDLIHSMNQLNIPAVGMSSFGPTCFGITDENPKYLEKELKRMINDDINIITTNGKNHGSTIKK